MIIVITGNGDEILTKIRVHRMTIRAGVELVGVVDIHDTETTEETIIRSKQDFGRLMGSIVIIILIILKHEKLLLII